MGSEASAPAGDAPSRLEPGGPAVDLASPAAGAPPRAAAPAAGCCMCETAGADSGLCMAAACCMAQRSLEERRRRPRPADALSNPSPPRPGMHMGLLLCRAALPALPQGDPSSSSSSSSAAAAMYTPPVLAGLVTDAARPPGAPAGTGAAEEGVRGGLARGGRPLGEPTR